MSVRGLMFFGEEGGSSVWGGGSLCPGGGKVSVIKKARINDKALFSGSDPGFIHTERRTM